MLNVEQIDTANKKQVKRFVRIPYRLYANHPQWVPPLYMDVETQLNRSKHPFYEHSDADFFIASMDGRDVGRIAVLKISASMTITNQTGAVLPVRCEDIRKQRILCLREHLSGKSKG
jgi:hypothetical protein